MLYKKTKTILILHKSLTKPEILQTYKTVISALSVYKISEKHTCISTNSFFGTVKEFQENFVNQKCKHWNIMVDTDQNTSVSVICFNWPLKQIDIAVESKNESLAKDVCDSCFSFLKASLSKSASINHAYDSNEKTYATDYEPQKSPFYKSGVFLGAVGAIGTVIAAIAAFYK